MEPWEGGKRCFFQGFLLSALREKKKKRRLPGALGPHLSFSWAGKGDVVPPGYPPLQGKGTFWATAALALMRVVLSLAVPQVASTLHTPAWPGTPPGAEAGEGRKGGQHPGEGVLGAEMPFPPLGLMLWFPFGPGADATRRPAQLRSPVAAAQLGRILLPGEGAGLPTIRVRPGCFPPGLKSPHL